MPSATCALCGKPPNSRMWSRGDAFCHGCKHFVCFDCHIKGPGVIPSGPHTLDLHKGVPARRELHVAKPVLVDNVNEQQKGLEEMAITATAGSNKSYTPAPAGLHSGVCVDVVDLGFEKNKFDATKPDVHKVRIIWEIDEDNPDKPGERFTVAGKWTLSINQKASLRKFLVPWRGRDFTAEEEKGFDVEKLIGVPCLIQILHNVGEDGQTYANVSSVLPLQKGGKAKKVPAWYVRVKDRPPKEDAPPRARLTYSSCVVPLGSSAGK